MTEELQAKYDEYCEEHGYAPTPRELSKMAGVGFITANSFIMNKNKETSSKQKSMSAKASNIPSRNTVSSSGKSNQSGVDYSGAKTGANNPWNLLMKKKKNKAVSTLSSNSQQLVNTDSALEQSKALPADSSQNVSTLNASQKLMDQEADQKVDNDMDDEKIMKAQKKIEESRTPWMNTSQQLLSMRFEEQSAMKTAKLHTNDASAVIEAIDESQNLQQISDHVAQSSMADTTS